MLFETLQGERFKAHDGIHNRRLLWHGTNVAVVTAILKSGLRIMPHSGGRVGRGIYFASENSKSAGYGKRPFQHNTHPCAGAPLLSSLFPIPLSCPFAFYKVGCAGNIGIMFLNEVALGKEFSLYRDNSSLTSAPSGYESVVARGRTEPGEREKEAKHIPQWCAQLYLVLIGL